MGFHAFGTVRRGWFGILVTLGACGPWQRVGSDAEPDPNRVVPRLFDPTTVYREMGFIALGAPLPFVASVRYLAGPTEDSTFAVFGLSMANSALSFHRAAAGFEGGYRVEAAFRRDGDIVSQIASDQSVRVATFQETLRSDESVIFQQIISLPPGSFVTTVTVRDRNGVGFNRDERRLDVPRFGEGPGLSSLVPVYQGAPRTDRRPRPSILVNPRATVPYGTDTLFLYVEGLGLAAEAAVTMKAYDQDSEVWSETVQFEGSGTTRAVIVQVPPGQLPVGELRFVARLEGSTDSLAAPVLISFSDQWVVTNFVEVLSLLRYFGQDGVIKEMRDAPAEERPALWRAFWRTTDPNPVTPENEAVNEYFRRIQLANARFAEGADPGWLTDRGEVFVTLGEPDEVFDQSSDLQGRRRFIRWSFLSHRLVLDFVDESGFGRFRMTPAVRSDYHRVLSRVRRSG